MTEAKITETAQRLVKLCTEKGIRVSTAESCTGGMISAAITAIPGSSAVIELGFCSYSNRIKQEFLGVSAETLDKYTEYSIQCAAEMAQGAKNAAGSDYAVSTTGVAGPAGGSERHPVGEVCIGISSPAGAHAQRYVFAGGRNDIRAQAALTALEMLIAEITR
ncbi:MAG: CinA family protein [Oscillospiraceae bacterium]